MILAPSIKHFLFNTYHTIVKWALPWTCILCESKTDRQLDLCISCEKDLPWIENACGQCGIPFDFKTQEKKVCGKCLVKKPYYDNTIALFYYHEPITRLITQLKFNNDLINAKTLGELLLKQVNRHIQTTDDKPDVIMPMPLHKKRLQERGFNQALEIAHSCAKSLDIPIDIKSCRKIKATEAQSSIPADMRKKNVRGVFAIDGTMPHKHVAIIDDVVTTGNSVLELSKCLKMAGVKRVDVWCVARTTPTHS